MPSEEQAVERTLASLEPRESELQTVVPLLMVFELVTEPATVV